jgi:cysteine desulfurase
MMKKTIYLDNNATTSIDPEVVDVMLKELKEKPHNPSSIHAFGREAKSLLSSARKKLAEFFSFGFDEIIFTSGATEALNMTIRGIAENLPLGKILTTDIEHVAVDLPVQALGKKGFSPKYLKTGELGAVTPEMVEKAIDEETRLIILSAVNTETGVKTDFEAIGAIAKKRNIPFILDGVGLLGKEEFSLPEGVSAACFSAHKFHGPKGVGFAILRKKVPMTSLFLGGGQENGKRAGTENLAGILGLEKALSLLKKHLPEATIRMEKLRNQLENGFKEKIPYIVINGKGNRVVNVANIAFPGIDGELLLHKLDEEGILVSLGSACSSGGVEVSRVLLNMGIQREIAASSVRFSLSRLTTEEEIEKVIETTSNIVYKIRSLGSK